MSDGREERENWIDTGRWLIERLQARLEDRIIDGDIEIEEAKNSSALISKSEREDNDDT